MFTASVRFAEPGDFVAVVVEDVDLLADVGEIAVGGSVEETAALEWLVEGLIVNHLMPFSPMRHSATASESMMVSMPRVRRYKPQLHRYSHWAFSSKVIVLQFQSRQPTARPCQTIGFLF